MNHYNQQIELLPLWNDANFYAQSRASNLLEIMETAVASGQINEGTYLGQCNFIQQQYNTKYWHYLYITQLIEDQRFTS